MSANRYSGALVEFFFFRHDTVVEVQRLVTEVEKLQGINKLVKVV